MLIQTKSQLERERMEKENLIHQLKDVREDAKRRISTLEGRNRDLENDISHVNVQMKSGENSRQKIDNLME